MSVEKTIISDTSIVLYRGQPYDSDYYNAGLRSGYSHYTQTIRAYIDIVADDIDFELDGIFNKGLKALDVGCGTGVLVDELNRRGLNTDGLDISSYAITEAQSLYPSYTFINEDFITNTISNNTYDIVIAIGLIGCATDKATADDMLSELKRVAKSGYKAFFTLNVEGNTYLNYTLAEVDNIRTGGLFPSKLVSTTNLVDSGILDPDELYARTSLGSFGWKLVVK